MAAKAAHAAMHLRRSFFEAKERPVADFAGMSATMWRYDTGVEAVRLANARGHIVALPYMGQIVWSAAFDGIELAMQSMFAEPRPATVIVETYGCLAYHAGMLRNGVPSAGDDHVLHGEMPCAPMDAAGLACGEDAQGPWLALTGVREYAMGFGAHYRATPRVVMRPAASEFDMVMEVENLSAAPMDLMYLCHANFAFDEGARFVQPLPFTPEAVVARTAIPSFVAATDDYRALIAELAANPARMRTLDEPQRYDPEQVFYIKGVSRGADGLAHFMLARRAGDGFTIAWDPDSMPHTIRWVLVNSDQRVAAFAMPGTCEPEGYLAEKRKGHVRSLAGGAKATFATRLGYIDKAHAGELARRIEAGAA
jgi:hypothetical protein